MTMTKKEMFELLANFFENAELEKILNYENQKTATTTEIVDFLHHEIDLLNKKSSSPLKPTKTQLENEKIKQIILTSLAEHDSPMTVTDLNQFELLSKFSNQKITSLLSQLVKTNEVVRKTIKKQSFYMLAVDEEKTNLEEEEETV